MATINLNGNEYTLATNLRVAYEVQGQHNHESYVTLFSKVSEMTIEEQIDILYASFRVGNPEDAKTFTREMFRNYILNSNDFTASKIMLMLRDVMSGILGNDMIADAEEVATGEAKN